MLSFHQICESYSLALFTESNPSIVSMLRVPAIDTKLSMHLLIHTYFDIDGLVTWIDVRQQQVLCRSLQGVSNYLRADVLESLIFVARIRGAKMQKGSKPRGYDEMKLDIFIQQYLLKEKKENVRKSYEQKPDGKTLNGSI